MNRYLLFSLLLVKVAVAQTEHTIDFLNLNNADFEHTFSYKQKARVRIDNINRFLYKVSVDKTETDFNVTVPTVLSGIKLPAFLSRQIPANAVPSPAPFNSNPKTAAAWQTEFDKQLNVLINVQQDLDDIIDAHNQIVNISRSCSVPYATIENDVISLLLPLVTAPKHTIPELSNALEAKLLQDIQIARISYRQMDEAYRHWVVEKTNEYRVGATGDGDVLAELNRDLANLEQKQKGAKGAVRNNLDNLIFEKEKEIRHAKARQMDSQEDHEKQIKDNEVDLEKAKTLLEDINKYQEDGKLYTLVNDIRKVNPSSYTYYSETVKMKKDEAKFNFSVTSDGPLTCNQSQEKIFEVSLRTKGGIKLDFSTGVFFSFGNEDFLGRDYYYQSVDGAKSIIISADGGKRALLSIGALMHIYKRSPAKVKFGGAVGASSTVSFEALNFHIGPSLIFGDKERFCLSAGLTFRETKILDKRYTLNQNYSTETLPESVPSVNKFPVGGTFIALTYNFTRFNK